MPTLSINNFSEPNFQSQSIALITQCGLSYYAKKRCIRLLPAFVNYDQFCGLQLLLRRGIWEDHFLSSFDTIFHVSMWQSLCDQMYVLTFEPIVGSIRDLLR